MMLNGNARAVLFLVVLQGEVPQRCLPLFKCVHINCNICVLAFWACASLLWHFAPGRELSIKATRAGFSVLYCTNKASVTLWARISAASTTLRIPTRNAFIRHWQISCWWIGADCSASEFPYSWKLRDLWRQRGQYLHGCTCAVKNVDNVAQSLGLSLRSHLIPLDFYRFHWTTKAKSTM